jgi:hypothetical protein
MKKSELKTEIDRLLKIIEKLDDSTNFVLEIVDSQIDSSTIILNELDIVSVKINL